MIKLEKEFIRYKLDDGFGYGYILEDNIERINPITDQKDIYIKVYNIEDVRFNNGEIVIIPHTILKRNIEYIYDLRGTIKFEYE